jgi:hypothetical protein
MIFAGTSQNHFLYRDLGCVLVAHVGGNLNNGSNAGLRNWNLNNSSSNTNWNIGRQTLAVKIGDCRNEVKYATKK